MRSASSASQAVHACTSPWARNCTRQSRGPRGGGQPVHTGRVELRVRHVEGPECDRQSEDRPVGGHGGERGVLVRDELGGGFDLLDARLSLLIASMASGVPSRMGSAGIADFTSTSSTTSDNTTILDCPGFLGGVTYGKLGS